MRLARWTIASPKRLAPLCGYKVAGEPRAGYRAGFGAGAITRALKLRHTQSSGVAHKSCGDGQIMRKAFAVSGRMPSCSEPAPEGLSASVTARSFARSSGREATAKAEDSRMPSRWCSRASGAGAHQFTPAKHTHEGRHQQHPN